MAVVSPQRAMRRGGVTRERISPLHSELPPNIAAREGAVNVCSRPLTRMLANVRQTRLTVAGPGQRQLSPGGPLADIRLTPDRLSTNIRRFGRRGSLSPGQRLPPLNASRREGLVHDVHGFLLDALQVLRTFETFGVDLVHVFGAGRARGEPAVVRNDFQATD